MRKACLFIAGILLFSSFASGQRSPATAQVYWSTKAAGSFELYLQNGQGSGANTTTVSEIDCIGVHN